MTMLKACVSYLKLLLYQLVVQSGVINLLVALLVPRLGKRLMNAKKRKNFNHVIRDGSGKTLHVTKCKGKLYPPFGEEKLDVIKNLQIRDSDILLVGYPKTGAHFVFEVINMLVTGSRQLSHLGKDFSGFMEILPEIALDSLPAPRILNTHLKFEDLPRQIREKKTKIVLTVRNPKDTLVSYFNHHRNLGHYDGELLDYFQLFVQGEITYGSYFEYYLDWDRLVRTPPATNPILPVSFEEMKDKPRETVRRIAEFLNVKVTEQDVEAITEVSNFRNMKAKRKNGFTGMLYRKGKTGDWRNWLTEPQNDVIDRMWKDKMADCFFQPKY